MCAFDPELNKLDQAGSTNVRMASRLSDIERRLAALEQHRPISNSSNTVRVGTDGVTGASGSINSGNVWGLINMGNPATTVLMWSHTAGGYDETWHIDAKTIVTANSANWTRFISRYFISDGSGGTIGTSPVNGNAQSNSGEADGGWTDLVYGVYPLTIPAYTTRRVQLQVTATGSFGGNYWSGDGYTHIRGIRA